MPQAPPEFAKCKREEVRGATLSILSYQCAGPEAGNTILIADDTLPGFVVESQGPDGTSRRVAVRVFKKAADAPVSSVLDAIRAASPGPHTVTCVLNPWRDSEGTEDLKRFIFEPAGEAAKAWEASQTNGGETGSPCGAMGVQFAGDLYFEELIDDPTTVVFVDAGSEIQIFDPATLKVLK